MSLDAGKILIAIGVVLILVGVFVSFGKYIPWLGKLPGDIYIKRDSFQFYFPLATSILVSIILTLLLYFFRK